MTECNQDMTRRNFVVDAVSAVLLTGGCCSLSNGDPETPKTELDKARLVADSFLLRHPYEQEKYALWWNWATLWWGVTQLGLADRSSRYIDFILKLGEHFKWGWHEDGNHGYHADSQCIGQAYLDLALAGVTDKGAKVIRTLEDRIAFNAPATGDSLDWSQRRLRRWKWCDALFMAPTSFVRMAQWTGDRRYLEFADLEYRATVDFLFDRDHGFFWRDSRFIGRRGENGKPEFWSRGNGWVFASLAIMLKHMPGDWPTRGWYIDIFRRMAQSIKMAQSADGTWHANLLDPEANGNSPEMSGTCLFLYGYCWGLNNSLLDEAEYGVTVARAWDVVTAAITPDGRIGHMQRMAAAPGTAGIDEEAPYGVGAFLAACTEMQTRREKIKGTHPSEK